MRLLPLAGCAVAGIDPARHMFGGRFGGRNLAPDECYALREWAASRRYVAEASACSLDPNAERAQNGSMDATRIAREGPNRKAGDRAAAGPGWEEKRARPDSNRRRTD